ncbi:hypothetical protein AB0J83_48275 [Actinoplanes sp. NPDC049596]|uniref:hypothetical protein n=1 Tax=Actinoplanes sp. NPDC049596 TaxID=3154625 RepID=UPI00342B1955
MTEIAAILRMTAPDMTAQEAVAAGMPPYAVLSMQLMNEVAQPARPEFARDLWASRSPRSSSGCRPRSMGIPP